MRPGGSAHRTRSPPSLSGEEGDKCTYEATHLFSFYTSRRARTRVQPRGGNLIYHVVSVQSWGHVLLHYGVTELPPRGGSTVEVKYSVPSWSIRNTQSLQWKFPGVCYEDLKLNVSSKYSKVCKVRIE